MSDSWYPPFPMKALPPPSTTFMRSHEGTVAWCTDPWCPPGSIHQVDVAQMHPGSHPPIWIIGSPKSFDALLAVNLAAAYRPEGV